MFETSGLPRLRDARSFRFSSWDRTGGNRDFRTIAPGKTECLADVKGAGSVVHVWVTINSPDPDILRTALLRMFWDGERHPSVLCPLGDFFGVGHARTVNFSTPVLSMGPNDGKGMNCWFPMPFARGARIELVNQSRKPISNFYFYVDVEGYPDARAVEGLGRFHVQWRRQNPTDGKDVRRYTIRDQFRGRNRTGSGNYVVLEAAGRGHYVGCHVDLFNRRNTKEWNWYGEGDDMIFIDGERWPPSLHGTGTEDYFGMAWCPNQFFNGVWHGALLPGGPNWAEPVTVYRYHVADPVHFRRSIRVTIEHGHNNLRSDDWSSTAYWYQAEPHAPFGIASAAARRP